jgi:hypothetical protein
MFAKETADLLIRLQQGLGQGMGRGLGQGEVALKCECQNLETIYINLDENGELWVGDKSETFRYLTEQNDSTYRPINQIDMTAIRDLCQTLQVDLNDRDPDRYPSIEFKVPPTDLIADAVEHIANAIDAIFSFVMREDLK